MDKELRKEYMAELRDDFDVDEMAEILDNIDLEATDFQIGNFRFIHQDNIDQILIDELSLDTHMLGCFTAWFIADITGISVEAVEKAQKADSYEVLGELMLQKIELVAENYVASDSYGRHFASYDGDENMVKDYYYFRNN